MDARLHGASGKWQVIVATPGSTRLEVVATARAPVVSVPAGAAPLLCAKGTYTNIQSHAPFVALITDFADGGTLTAYVTARDGALSGGAVKPIAGQLLAGLAELHRLGIVHRDLKPDNVLLHESLWKLSDFGIAKNTGVQQTTTLKGAGTEGYAPPEQFARAEASSPADVYSFGKVLAFMLTGHTDADRVPHAWRPLVYRCTEREPDRRCTLDEADEELARLRV